MLLTAFTASAKTNNPSSITNLYPNSNYAIANQANLFVADQNEIYAVTYNGGIYKSLDQGAHWIAINNGFASNYITDMLV